jgi:hypothetical protein
MPTHTRQHSAPAHAKQHRQVARAAVERRRNQAHHRRHHLETHYDPVAYGREHVPVPPVLGLTLEKIDKLEIVQFTLISGDRRAGVAERFGHSSQTYLFLHQNDPGFNPANPPLTSTHEYRNGGENPRYPGYVGGPAFPRVPMGKLLGPQALGLDLASNGEATAFCRAVAKHGLDFFQPYPTGSELHHICCRMSAEDLVMWLVHHKVIR